MSEHPQRTPLFANRKSAVIFLIMLLLFTVIMSIQVFTSISLSDESERIGDFLSDGVMSWIESWL